jgi:putative salt-induced outer membrane protein
LENLRFRENADYLVSFEDTDKYFINSETALEVKISEDFSLGVSYITAYQNQLPSPELKHTDTTFLSSLIIDF